MDNFSTTIRILVSVSVGIFAMILTRLGFGDLSKQLDGLVLVLTPMVYTAVVKWLETKHPNWGYLLGAKKPQSKNEETENNVQEAS